MFDISSIVPFYPKPPEPLIEKEEYAPKNLLKAETDRVMSELFIQIV